MPGPGEFQIIRDYFATAPQGPGVLLGIGDDCALLQAPQNTILATSVDTLVADVHFPAQADPAKIAARALRVNLSDLAAMNATPLWFTLALILPHSDALWLQQFSQGLLETAAEFSISLVGGDTTKGPLSITIQVTGSCAHTSKPLRRDGAKVGDHVFVSNSLGAAAAALPFVLGQKTTDNKQLQQAQSAYYLPQPQFALAEVIAPFASSAIDISDGLIADLTHICTASGVSAELTVEKIPVAVLARQLNTNHALQLAASGGDDYQLCFTIAEQHLPLLIKKQLPVTCIGQLVAGKGNVHCSLNGKPWRTQQTGFQHF